MRGRAIRLLILLWLGWYVSGPAAETVDFWDSPQEEISDVLHSAGGFATLVGVAICFAIGLFRKLYDAWIAVARRVQQRALFFLPQPLEFPTLAILIIAHSPPAPLRI
jgi:hypothetical protein